VRPDGGRPRPRGDRNRATRAHAGCGCSRRPRTTDPTQCHGNPASTGRTDPSIHRAVLTAWPYLSLQSPDSHDGQPCSGGNFQLTERILLTSRPEKIRNICLCPGGGRSQRVFETSFDSPCQPPLKERVAGSKLAIFFADESSERAQHIGVQGSERGRWRPS